MKIMYTINPTNNFLQNTDKKYLGLFLSGEVYLVLGNIQMSVFIPIFMHNMMMIKAMITGKISQSDFEIMG